MGWLLAPAMRRWRADRLPWPVLLLRGRGAQPFPPLDMKRLLLILLLLNGCQAVYKHSGSSGTVTSRNHPREAEFFYSQAAYFSEKVCEILGVEEQPFTLEVGPLKDPGSGNTIWGHRIQIDDRVFPHLYEFVLAHELTHWNLPHHDMPRVVEEGICNFIAYQVVSEAAKQDWLENFEKLAEGSRDVNDYIHLNLKEFSRLPTPIGRAAYLAGFDYVREVGLEAAMKATARGILESADAP